MNRRTTRATRSGTPPLLDYDVARQLTRFPRDIRLSDFKLRLRELRIADRDLLKSFFARCSPEAIRYRFMTSIKAPSDSLLDYLADADGSRHVALIVTQGQGDDEQIVAESRYVVFKDRPDTADIAFLVLDEMQRRGIATILIRELMEIARGRGLTLFSADVLADNRPTARRGPSLNFNPERETRNREPLFGATALTASSHAHSVESVESLPHPTSRLTLASG